MITISAVLGVGLYFRGGLILGLGGPLVVLLSFSLVGILAWAVMQCIAEMLCIWPIPGALSVYVTEFVDAELGIAVGIAYWFTYAISFAALIAATAAEAELWNKSPAIQGGVLFFLIPVFLLVLNGFGVEIYGFIEVVGGSLKLLFLLVIIVAMIAINRGAGYEGLIGTSRYPASMTVHNPDVTSSWPQAFFVSLSIATFAFVGVEIVAASALEARVPQKRNSAKTGTVDKTVRFSAVFISFFATILYVLAGFLVSLNIKWDSKNLPSPSWASRKKKPGTTSSAFVLVAEKSKIPGLASTLNVFLMFTALTSANTNLYVASRALFSLTRRLDGGPGQPLYIRVLAWMGKTNRRRVPMRALVVSCVFLFVPYLYLFPHEPQTSIEMILDVLAEIGSVGVIIVWTCECWAFIRFYHCIEYHRDALRGVTMVRRWNTGRNDLADDYPYRSHGQPFLAYCALSACLFILIVANGASSWHHPRAEPFLSAYLAPISFIALWILIKFLRNGRWQLVDLSNGDDVAKKDEKAP